MKISIDIECTYLCYINIKKIHPLEDLTVCWKWLCNKNKHKETRFAAARIIKNRESLVSLCKVQFSSVFLSGRSIVLR